MIRPVLPAAVAVTAGAAVGSSVPVPVSGLAVLGALLLAAAWRRPRAFPRRSAALLWLSFIAAGAAWAGAVRAHKQGLVFGQELPAGTEVAVSGKITGPVDFTGEDRAVTLLELTQCQAGDGWRPARGRVRLTLAGRSVHDVLPGDRLMLRVLLERPHLPRNSSRREVEQQLLSREYERTAVVSKWIQVQQIDRPAVSFARAVQHIRQRAKQAMRRGAGEERAAMLGMLLLGDRFGLEEGDAELFRQGGLFHLLVISGMHVGLLTAMVYGAAGWLGAGARVRAAIALGALLLFFALVPGQPPVIRATWACAIHLSAVVLWRRAEPVNTVSVAALLMTARDPQITLDPGYQLTVIATLAILLLRSPFVLLLDRIPWPKARDLLAVSLAAQLGISPLAARYFHRVPVFSLLPSLLALPFVAAALALGAAGLVAAPLWAPAAEVLFSAAGLVLAGLRAIARLSAHSMVATAPCHDPGTAGIIAYYVLLLGCASPWALSRISPRAAAAGVLAVALPLFTVGHGARTRAGHGELTIDFLDVSNGDAIVVRCPAGEVLVFDGGGVPGTGRDPLAGNLTRFLRSQGLFLIDNMFLTHPHPDHAHGLITALRSLPVGRLWLADGETRDPVRRRVLSTAGQTRVPVNLLPEPGRGRLVLDSNVRSQVFRIRYGDIAVLLTGDITAVTEAFIVQSGLDCRAQILKVPHHGSRTSCEPEWLSLVRPDVAVVSCGLRNPFGHPHPETLRSIERSPYRPTVLTTAEHGAVRLRTDGRQIWTETWSGVTISGCVQESQSVEYQ